MWGLAALGCVVFIRHPVNIYHVSAFLGFTPLRKQLVNQKWDTLPWGFARLSTEPDPKLASIWWVLYRRDLNVEIFRPLFALSKKPDETNERLSGCELVLTLAFVSCALSVGGFSQSQTSLARGGEKPGRACIICQQIVCFHSKSYRMMAPLFGALESTTRLWAGGSAQTSMMQSVTSLPAGISQNLGLRHDGLDSWRIIIHLSDC